MAINRLNQLASKVGSLTYKELRDFIDISIEILTEAGGDIKYINNLKHLKDTFNSGHIRYYKRVILEVKTALSLLKGNEDLVRQLDILYNNLKGTKVTTNQFLPFKEVLVTLDTLNNTPEEPEPEEPELTLPLKFAFGPSAMPDVEGWTTIKFEEFTGNKYLTIPDKEEIVIAEEENAGFEEAVLFSEEYSPQNIYGWRGLEESTSPSFIVIQELDPEKKYNITITVLPDPDIELDTSITSSVDLYNDDLGETPIDSHDKTIYNGSDGEATGVVEEAHTFSEISPSETGFFYIAIYKSSEGPATLNSIEISEVEEEPEE